MKKNRMQANDGSRKWMICLLITLLPVAVFAETYHYDAAGRLGSATYDDGSKITYSYDANGNMLGKTMSVVVLDTVKPVITLLGVSPLTIALGSVYNDAGATAMDDVDGNLTANIITVNPVDTAGVDTYTVTYNVSDAATNAATEVIRTVHVTDQTAPVVTAPGDLVVEAVGTTTAVALGNASVADNVDTGLAATADNNGPFPLGNHTVTWSATDNANNTGTDTQSLTVQDTTAPVINAGTPLTAVTVEATGASTSVTLTNPAATDVFSVTFGNNAPATFPLGTTTVTWTATDANNQSSTTTQEVIVQDTTAPVINGTPLAAITVEATAVNTAVALTPPTANDIFTVTVSNDAPANGFPVGATGVTWTVTDANNQSSIATQEVIVQDTASPVFTNALEDITFEATANITPVNLTAPNATDLFPLTVTNDAPNAFPVGTTAVVWTATDANGNQSSISHAVTVQDSTPPTLTLNGSDPLTVTQGSAFSDPGTSVSDLVDGNVTVSVTGVVDTRVLGTVRLTYTATDAANNSAQMTRDVHVIASASATLPNNDTVQVDLPLGVGFSGPVTTGTVQNGPAGIVSDLGTVSFSLAVPNVGGSVSIALSFSAPLPANLILYKVDNSNNFTPIPTNLWTLTGANSLEITLTDGGPFDLDGTANGTVVDPIAFAAITPIAATGGGSGGGSFSLLLLFFLMVGWMSRAERSSRTRI